MRVWVYQDAWREFGERRFEITWWAMKKSVLNNPDFKSGNWDFDPDRDAYEAFEVRKTRESAEKRAQQIADTHDDLVWGGVDVQEQVVDWFVREDNVAEWANVGESVEFTADLEVAHA